MDTDTTLVVWSLMLGGVGEKTDEARDDDVEYNDDGVSEVVGEVISTMLKVLGDEKVEKRTEWQWIPATHTTAMDSCSPRPAVTEWVVNIQ